MKTKIFILFALLFGLISYRAYSQAGLGLGSGLYNIYDVNTIETISGEVASFEKVFSGNNTTYGITLALYSGNGQISVHLGPSWFVENQEIKITEGDYINVTGSRVFYHGNQIIIAKEIMKENKVLLLRSDSGYPLWAAMPDKY